VVTPRGRFVWGGSYVPGSLIWRSRWVTTDGVVECREALALPTRADRAVLLRRIDVLEGEARVDVRMRLRADWGREPARELHRRDDGTWTGMAGEIPFAWRAGREGVAADDELRLDLRLSAGERHDLVLALGADAVPRAADAWAETEAAWAGRVPELDATAAPRDARHAVAVLAGLTAPSGGTVAAATTALPERAEEGRNYDYRYAWIRDGALAGQALAAAGCWDAFDAGVGFVVARVLEHGPDLRPAYTVDGGRVPDEHPLGLPGYPGGGDRAGNRVNEQFQLDGFGELLRLLATAARRDRLDRDGRRAAEIAAAAIGARHREPEAGIWELDNRHWTHSRLVGATGLREMEAAVGGTHDDWLRLADRLVADAAAQATHPSGRWQRAPDDPRVDAALLLPGALAPDRERAERTLRAVERELCDDGYCYRYPPEHGELADAEGAFLLCGFALALARHTTGDAIGAARAFDRNRSGSGPPGLLAEEFDVRQRQLRGNLPQAFVHGLLLQCAVELAR
jgi:alpha,alpha-trehalase